MTHSWFGGPDTLVRLGQTRVSGPLARWAGHTCPARTDKSVCPTGTLGSFGGIVAECVELFVDLADQAVVLGIVAELNPAEPIAERRNRIARLDLLPGVLLRIVSEDAGRIVFL